MVVRGDQGSTSSQDDERLRRPNYSKELRSERKLLVISPVDHPMLAAARQNPKRNAGLHGFLDSLTNICAPFSCALSSGGLRDAPPAKVAYPVERYSDFAALDVASLIQRRREDMRHRLFRPVSEDDESCFHPQGGQSYAM
ncbi:hypothetical protein MHU86_130 [Fragilaria crotonensis]|nr:hypothetical protein MHU86_130 [Fragilaria crotonensis]